MKSKILYLLILLCSCVERNKPSGQMPSTENKSRVKSINKLSNEELRDKVIFFEITDVSGNKMKIVNRIIGIPGDILLFKNGNIYINGVKYKFPESMKFHYKISLLKYSTEIANDLGIINMDNEGYYNGFLTAKDSVKGMLKYKDVIRYMKRGILKDLNQETLLNGNNHFGWDQDNFGPIKIPKAGELFDLDSANIYFNEKKARDSKNGKYVISKNYYFLLTDDFHNGFDSRALGLIGEDQIIEIIKN